MANMIEESITVRLTRLVRSSVTESDPMVTPEIVELIDATLQEVLTLPAGTVVEVYRNEG